MNFTQYVAIGCMYLILDTRILKYSFATKAIKWEINTFNCRSGTLLSSTLPLPFSFFNLYEISLKYTKAIWYSFHYMQVAVLNTCNRKKYLDGLFKNFVNTFTSSNNHPNLNGCYFS